MIPAWLAFFDGLLAVALVAAGVVAAHFYLTPPFFGFRLFTAGFLLSVFGFILGIIGFFTTRPPDRRVARPRAIIGLLLSLAVALPVFAVIVAHSQYPAINDITTDFENPPEFIHAVELVPNRGRDMKYDRDKYMAAQQKGYPSLAPASISGDQAAVFERVKSLASSIPDWQLTYVDPKTMTIEGVSTSTLFHFQDDFIIQVRPGPDGTSLVEMRSKSRDGIGDLGVNYNRIVMFLGRLRNAG